MSYCVNCGVELDKTCAVCPLCNTKVINPNQTVDNISPKPYPTERGSIDPVTRRDMTILITVCLAATAMVCGLMNIFFITRTSWSLYIIGVCAILWVLFLPIFFPVRMPIYISILLDGLGAALYFVSIAWMHPGNGWYTAIALPLIILSTLLIEIFIYCLKHPRRSIISQAIVFVADVGVLTVSIELLVRHYGGQAMTLSWSAIVLTCCIIIDATLITILRVTRLREEVRRRMHI